MPRRAKTGNAKGRMSKALALATQSQIMRQYTRGKTVDQIAVSLNLLPATVETHLNEALDKLVLQWAKPSPQHTFVRYASFQMGIIDKLQRSYDSFMGDEDNKQYGAAVSALRAQSDIMDKIVGKGIEYGVITQRKADRAVSMSRADLRLELQNEIALLASLLDKVDSHDQFKQRRAAALKGRPQPKGKRYLVRIRKVKRNALGFITAVPDWKFKKQAHEEAQQGYIPQHHPTAQAAFQLQEQDIQIDITTGQIPTEQDDGLFQAYAQHRAQRKVVDVTPKQLPPAKQEEKVAAGYDIPTDYTS